MMGKPDMPEKLEVYNVDGIDVYVAKNVKPHESGIKIYMKRFLWIKTIAVDGIYIDHL